ncbi:hypothetical protein KKF91_09875 [Myxococcota bacterium]|nr:hypothetical protein [Myxococcota bacterium]MBU1430851.1 hypothetical protein [Myxococcota bacterium]MBU1899036.1 hypothetical protein [Myxococcota bacterium]
MFKSPDALDGVYVGIVTSNQDPMNMGRVKVRFPWLDDTAESFWARLVRPYAGKERGFFFMPEVGDEVLCVFELGDVHQPLVIGATWNGTDEPVEPGDPDGQNHHKIIETRAGHKVHFDDTPGAEFIQIHDGSLNNSLRWDSAADALTITSKTGDIIVRAPSGKIALLAKDIRMIASGGHSRSVGGAETTNVKMSATEAGAGGGASKTWNAKTSLTITASTVKMGATGSMSIGGGSAAISAGGGAPTKITVDGPTTDTVSDLNVEADHLNERAESRSLSVGQMSMKSQSVSFDASATLSLTAPSFNADVPAGQLSLLGEIMQLQAGNMVLKAAQIQLNPMTPAIPKPGVPARVIIDAARAGGA